MKPSSHKSEIRRAEREREIVSRLKAAGQTAFGRNGLYATRVEEITELAGVAKGTFYLYFESKEELIQAIAGEVLRELGRACEQACEPALAWPERVAAIARAHLLFFVENPAAMRILHQLRGMLKFELPEWQPLRAILRSHIEALAELLSAPPAPPEALSPEGARHLSRALFGAVSGATSVWIASEGADSPPPLDALIPALVAFSAAFLGAHSLQSEEVQPR